MGPPIKLKTTGTLNLAGAPIHHPHAPAPPHHHHQHPLGSAHIHRRLPGEIPGPKKRGRKPKSDPDSLYQRQARMVDEVTYNIASPPPRAHSLRQSASQLTFDEDGVRPGAAPFIPGMGMTIDGMGLGGGGLPGEDGGPAAATAVAPVAREPYIPEPYPHPNFPATPPTKEELSRLLAKIKEKDTIHIFHDPVTDAEAPGYSNVISTPMDLATMRKKLEGGGGDEGEGGGGAYSDWPEFWEDLDLMFMNALTYNQPPDKIHGYALRLRKTVASMVSKVRANAKNAKDATKRAAAQKKAAAAKAERDAAARQARAELKAAQEAKVLKRAGVGDDGGEDLEARATYKSYSTNPMAAVWGGLYGGCSVEGALFGRDKLLLKASNPIPSSEGYAASMLRFASGLVGRARELVMAKINAAKETRENVIPPTNPPITMSNTAQQGKGGKKAKQQQQQPTAAVLAPPPVSLFHAQQQPPPVLGALPPVTALTGINPLPGAMPTTMIQPTPAMAAAASAHMLASQAQAHVASTTSGMPSAAGFPPQMQFVYQPLQHQHQQGMLQGQMLMPQSGQFIQPLSGAGAANGGFHQQQMQMQQQQQQQQPMMLPMQMQQGQVMYQQQPQQQQQQQYPGVPPS
jgi:Bromodomain